MLSFELILDKFTSEHNNITLPQFLKLVEQYLQQDTLSQCPALYQKLLEEWNKESTPNIQIIKKVFNMEEVHLQFETAFVNSLQLLFNSNLDAIQQEFFDAQSNDENKEKIESCVIQLMMPYLMAKGKDHVTAQARSLSLMFHPDKRNKFTKTILWLEDRLGEDHCFKLINVCKERIENPQIQIPISETDCNSGSVKISRLIELLKQRSIDAQTYSERLFCKALLELFHDMSEYSNTSIHVESRLSQILYKIMPIAGSLYTLSFFAPEILFISALTAAMGFSEGSLEKSSSQTLNTLGEQFASIRQVLFYNTSTMIFAITSGNLKVTNFASEGLLSVSRLLSGEPDTSHHQLQFEGREFKTLSLKFIACHLEKYIEMQQSQWIAGYRQGSTKSLLFSQILQEMESIDKEEINLGEKLDTVEKRLAEALVMPEIIASGLQAKNALNKALTELKDAQQALVGLEQQNFYSLFHAMLKPLQDYITVQSRQWGAGWRTGANKVDKLSQTITYLNIIKSNEEINYDEKKERMRQQLELLQFDELINSSGQNAINAVNKALQAFSANSPEQSVNNMNCSMLI